MSGITVAVRVRPFNEREHRFESKNIIGMNPAAEPGVVRVQPVRRGVVLEQDPPKVFNFDSSLWSHEPCSNIPFAHQADVYDAIGADIVSNVLEGYYGCVLAYGQTGSGKTYSMMGVGGDEGLTPRMIHAVFSHAQAISQNGTSSYCHFSMQCSYLEIYNESVCDLLLAALPQAPQSPRGGRSAPPASLKIRQHPQNGMFVEGLSALPVTCAEDVVHLLSTGNQYRHVSSTLMNSTSSRSHAILFLSVMASDEEACLKRASRLSLVDLAGSERASSTGAEGETLAEGASINRSLSVLGICLERVAEMQEKSKKSLPIPFRESALTFLLSDSIGGKSKTALLANISPADVNYEETLSTLRFAQIAKRIRNKAVVIEDPKQQLIRELKEELSVLKQHLAATRARHAPPIPAAVPPLLQPPHQQPCEKDADVCVAASASSETPTDSGADESMLTGPAANSPPEPCDDGDLIAAQVAACERRLQQEEDPDSDETAPRFPTVQATQSDDVVEDPTSELRSSLCLTASFASTLSCYVHESPRTTRSDHDEAVFMDWSCPYVVSLMPWASPMLWRIPEGVSILFVREGESGEPNWQIKLPGFGYDASSLRPVLELLHEPLVSAISIRRFGASEAAVELMSATSTSLVGEDWIRVAHQDRIRVVSQTVRGVPFLSVRISHCASLPLAPKFSKVLGVSASAHHHLMLLEMFGRFMIELQHVSSLPIADVLGNHSGVGEDRATLLQGAFHVEEQLSQRFPVLPEEMAAYLSQLERTRGQNAQRAAPSWELWSSKDVCVGCLRFREGEEESLQSLMLSFEEQRALASAEMDARRMEALQLSQKVELAQRARRARELSVAHANQKRIRSFTSAMSGLPSADVTSKLPTSVQTSEIEVDEDLFHRLLHGPVEDGSYTVTVDPAGAPSGDDRDGVGVTTEATAPLEVIDHTDAALLISDDDPRRLQTRLHEAAQEEACNEEARNEDRPLAGDQEDALNEEMDWLVKVAASHERRVDGPRISDYPDAASDLGVWRRFALDAKDKLPFLRELHKKQLLYYAVNRHEMRLQELTAILEEEASCASLPIHATMRDRALSTSLAPCMSYVIPDAPPLSPRNNGDDITHGDPRGVSLLPVTEQRAGYFWKLSQGKGSRWEHRFALVCGRFLYYFYSADGTCRCLAAVYLYGATIQIHHASFEQKDFAMHLQTTAPRRLKDTATSFHLAFNSEVERCLWAHWIVTAATPLPPRRSLRRLLDELHHDSQWSVDSFAHCCKAAPSIVVRRLLIHPAFWPQAPPTAHGALSRGSLVSATSLQHQNDSFTSQTASLLREKHLHWDPDETSLSCKRCASAFHFFRRRHHCRACGGVFCDACTLITDLLNANNEVRRKRVCLDCDSSRVQAVGQGSFCHVALPQNATPIDTAVGSQSEVNPMPLEQPRRCASASPQPTEYQGHFDV